MTATIIGPGLVLFTPPNPRAVGPARGSGTWASVLVPGCSHSGAQLPQAAQGKPRAGMVTAAPRTAAHRPQEARGRFSPSSESPRRARGQQQGAAVPEAPPRGRVRGPVPGLAPAGRWPKPRSPTPHGLAPSDCCNPLMGNDKTVINGNRSLPASFWSTSPPGKLIKC